MAYRQVGVYLTHWSQGQWHETQRISVSNAKPGDLIFWSRNGSSSGIYHVALYLGNNQILEAVQPGVPMRITSLYGWGNIIGAGRVA